MRSVERAVSIIIPTHNRRASVERALRALAAQSCSLSPIEVIVVADGCTDSTLEISRTDWPFAVRVLDQPGLGPAAARNRGAAAATGERLIFLDDDVEPFPGFVAAHVGAHDNGNSATVAIGYLPPQLQGRRDLFALMLRAWWEAMFERMREPGHRFVYSDLLSGNLSVGRMLFARVGGFDEGMRCHEDYELGARLIREGARLRFLPDATGWHHEHTGLARALERKRHEGRADVVLASLHPGLAPVLPLSTAGGHLTLRGRILRRLALSNPGAGDLIEAGCRSTLPLLEAARLRTRWRRLLDDLLSYWYWRGVGESLGGAPLATVRRSAAPDDCVAHDLDLKHGLAAAMVELDAIAPPAVRLTWGRLVVGTVTEQPGAEPLQGRHLPHLLRTRFAGRLADTLALTQLLERERASVVPATPVVRGDAQKQPA